MVKFLVAAISTLAFVGVSAAADLPRSQPAPIMPSYVGKAPKAPLGKAPKAPYPIAARG